MPCMCVKGSQALDTLVLEFRSYFEGGMKVVFTDMRRDEDLWWYICAYTVKMASKEYTYLQSVL